MFRVIFLTLLSFFAALAWLGTGAPQGRQAGLMPTLPRDMVARQTASAPARLFVAAEAAFLRAGATSAAEPVTLLPWGTEVQVLGGIENGYVPVEDTAGRRGYIATRLLSAREPAIRDTQL